MKELTKAIRAALSENATQETREEGIAACRAILEHLGASPPTGPTEVIEPDGTRVIDVSADPPNQPETPTPNVESPTSAASDPSTPTEFPPTGPLDPSAIAALVASLGKLPPEQLLDMAIARLRAALPHGAAVAPQSPLRFQLVPVHHLKRTK